MGSKLKSKGKGKAAVGKLAKDVSSRKKSEKNIKKAISQISAELGEMKKQLQKVISSDSKQDNLKDVKAKVLKLEKKTDKLDDSLKKYKNTGKPKKGRRKKLADFTAEHAEQHQMKMHENIVPSVPNLLDAVLNQDGGEEELDDIFDTGSVDYNAVDAIAHIKKLAKREEINKYIRNEKRKTVRNAADKKLLSLAKKGG